MPDKAEHPEKRHIRQRLMSLSVVIARLAVGGLFVYSGFVKAIDIWGVDYKIEDYLEAFGWIWLAPLSGFIAAALPIFEFVAGFLLAIGSFRRGTVVMLLGCMAVMLPLTAYIAIANPVADCGCFGDAWVISNHASFWKNVAITAGLIFLLRKNTLVRSLYGPAVQWLTAVIPALSLIPVITYGNIVQPMIDFRPYKIGASLTETREENGTTPNFTFIYTKDGKEQEFTIDNLPDSSWTFVDRRQIAVRQPDTAAGKPATDPIAIFDEDVSIDDLISHDGESLLLLIPDIEKIDALTNFQLNDLNDLATRQGIPLICLTSSTEEHIVEWRDISMSDYPVYRMDDSQLKTIARGNPAIVYTDNGSIRYKSTFGAFQGRLPEITDSSGCHLAALSDDSDDARHYLASLMLAMLALMGTLLLLNRTPLLIKFGIRLKKNQNKKVPSREDQTFQILNISKMRKNIVAGNWKMNTTLQEGVKLATDVNEALKARKPNCDVVICVPFTHLTSVNAVIDNTKLGLGAENCADKEKGAYTGEVSAAMVASTGAKYVILGHSERRQYYHETSETLKEKVTLALANGLTPIFCIGEVLEERENGTYFDVVKKQVEDALFSLSADDFKKLILAYEPVWAIGTGKTATADQAEEIHEFIRKTIASKYGDEVAESTSILYGGSCKPANAKELFSKPDVDGGLIGGAALDAVSFMGIVDAF